MAQMKRIQWPEISDVEPHINLMVAFDSGQGMQAWGHAYLWGLPKRCITGLGQMH